MAITCFEALYEAYAPMVYWAAFGMVNNHDTALELTQVVFLKAYEHWDTLLRLQEPQAKSWLFRSTRNATIDRIRKEKRELVVDSPPERADADAYGQPGRKRNRRRAGYGRGGAGAGRDRRLEPDCLAWRQGVCVHSVSGAGVASACRCSAVNRRMPPGNTARDASICEGAPLIYANRAGLLPGGLFRESAARIPCASLYTHLLLSFKLAAINA